MRKLKKILGYMLISVPFIGIGCICYLEGGMECVFFVFGGTILVVSIIKLGINWIVE